MDLKGLNINGTLCEGHLVILILVKKERMVILRIFFSFGERIFVIYALLFTFLYI